MSAKPETVSFTSSGLRLFGDRWSPDGESHGVVLLLHGGGQRRHSWRRTGQRLASRGWTTIALDARGHGDSDWSFDGDYSMDALVKDLVAVREAIGERVVLVGASMGGMTSLLAEGERGDIARGIVLVDIVARLEPEGVERIRAFLTQDPDGFATLEEAADAVAAYNPHRPRPASPDGLRRNLRHGEDGRWRWHWDPAFLDGGDEPNREVHYLRALSAAERIGVPTLIVRGVESDIVSAEGVAEMAALIPGAKTVSVPSAGHMVAGDDNDIFTASLEGFLDGLR